MNKTQTVNGKVCPTSEDWTIVLETTGVPFRFGMSRCHWNVLPASNLKPWTPEQEAALTAVVVRHGYRTTPYLVKMRGQYFEQVGAQPGKGFRIV